MAWIPAVRPIDRESAVARGSQGTRFRVGEGACDSAHEEFVLSYLRA
jgi:hypothetical protein